MNRKTTVPCAAACDLSPGGFARIARLVTAELGIRMPEGKQTMVQSRLLRRAGQLGLRSVEEYAEYLFRSGDSEREHLINAITTNKTDFFREPDHFEYLTSVALPSADPDILPAPRTVKVWSAGCSSGQEPYTLAMVLAEYVAARRGLDFAILATDVSTRVLEEARLGIYHESQIEPVPLAMRRKYLAASFDRNQRRVRIVPALRRKVSFHPLNFMLEDYPIRDRFDAIFFRNVMIYFDRPTQEAVTRRICRHLAPGGHLFVGHSESMGGLNLPLKPVGPAIFRSLE